MKPTDLIEIIRLLTHTSTQARSAASRDGNRVNGEATCFINPEWLKEVASNLEGVVTMLKAEFEDDGEIDLTKTRADHLKDRDPIEANDESQ